MQTGLKLSNLGGNFEQHLEWQILEFNEYIGTLTAKTTSNERSI